MKGQEKILKSHNSLVYSPDIFDVGYWSPIDIESSEPSALPPKLTKEETKAAKRLVQLKAWEIFQDKIPGNPLSFGSRFSPMNFAPGTIIRYEREYLITNLRKPPFITNSALLYVNPDKTLRPAQMQIKTKGNRIYEYEQWLAIVLQNGLDKHFFSLPGLNEIRASSLELNHLVLPLNHASQVGQATRQIVNNPLVGNYSTLSNTFERIERVNAAIIYDTAHLYDDILKVVSM